MDQKKRLRFLHESWISYLKPDGTVLSAGALAEHLVTFDSNWDRLRSKHQAFLEAARSKEREPLLRFLEEELGWNGGRLDRGAIAIRGSAYEMASFDTTLYADAVVCGKGEGTSPLAYVHWCGDDPTKKSTFGTWTATPLQKLVRHCREKRVPLGFLVGPHGLTWTYVPEDGLEGMLSFPVAALERTDGRSSFAALCEFLHAARLFSTEPKYGLLSLLQESRAFQGTVSEALCEQVLDALFELTRGFEAARGNSGSEPLERLLKDDPKVVSRGLLTVLLRIVFFLAAEDRDLIRTKSVATGDDLFARSYSLLGLHDALRDAEGRYPETLSARYGAWGRFLGLCRLVHGGVLHPELTCVAKRGDLFSPERYPFLEGREGGNAEEDYELPAISDAVVLRVLDELLFLNGERLSYRDLDVEQLGYVYEEMMGFEVETTQGRCLLVNGKKGIPFHFDVDAFLALRPEQRRAALEPLGLKASDASGQALFQAKTLEAAVEALRRRMRKGRNAEVIPKGHLIVQPSAARRRSGSHYTPRSFTAPIVEKTLEPVLTRLSGAENYGPSSKDLLDLKVCDPAMGSGAFLVEACRQIASHVMRAWEREGKTIALGDDEHTELAAQRQVARQCLYGVDKNPMAVDLAKLSLWLLTLARDKEFTFLDHCLKEGDSLVGLRKEQLCKAHWDVNGRETMFAPAVGGPGPRARSASFPPGPALSPTELVAATTIEAVTVREIIRSTKESAVESGELERWHQQSDEALETLRALGDVLVKVWFDGTQAKLKPKQLDEKRERAVVDVLTSIQNELGHLKAEVTAFRDAVVRPFHWDVEFAEVFQRKIGGFDVIVGNPPFAGKVTMAEFLPDEYSKWLKFTEPHSNGNADLVTHFLLKSFSLVRTSGSVGLIATKTVAEGDTREGGLQVLTRNGALIYSANRSEKWPGRAAVRVSIVHYLKSATEDNVPIIKLLDGKIVESIDSFLSKHNLDAKKVSLKENFGLSFRGATIMGAGFIYNPNFSGENEEIQIMRSKAFPPNKVSPVVFKYIGNEEMLESPVPIPTRKIINFQNLSQEDARKHEAQYALVEELVKPERVRLKDNPDGRRRKSKWWQLARDTPALRSALSSLQDCFIIPQTAAYYVVQRINCRNVLFDQSLTVIAKSDNATFASLQSRFHEVWVNLFSGKLEDRLRYNPTDCFSTYPFSLLSDPVSALKLEHAGETYFSFRERLMTKLGEGPTVLYSRFHNPHETSHDFLKLRELHQALDEAVCSSYGWSDITLTTDFFPVEDGEGNDAEERELPEARSRRGAKKTKHRLRWPDDLRDEILGRLLALNAERAAKEGTLDSPSEDEDDANESPEAEAASEAPSRARAKAKPVAVAGPGLHRGDAGTRPRRAKSSKQTG